MNWIVFDIETDGLDPTLVHCICLAEKEGAVETYHDDPKIPRTGTLDEGLLRLGGSETKIAHNGRGFDYPVLDRLHPELPVRGRRWDSIVMAKVRWPDEHLKQLDFARRNRGVDFPGQYVGRHSLKAWGYRLGEYKDESPDDWNVFTEDMAVYCAQDVEVLRELVLLIERKGWWDEAFELEHAFAEALTRQEKNGFKLDIAAATGLERLLVGRRAELDAELRERCGNFREWYMTPKKQILKLRTRIFNPGSRQQMARKLQDLHGWRPRHYTKKGDIKMDEKTVGVLPYPEAKLWVERLLVQKRIGQISEGEQAWLSLTDENDRVHGRINHNGAVTSRVKHSKPNMSAVPKVSKPYGPECRGCWTVDAGNVLVGVDASGLEARLQSHYTIPYDDGALRDLLLDGDFHAHNAEVLEEACERPISRGKAKEFLYALSYGAGDRKLGSVMGGGPSLGKRCRAALMGSLPGLAGLTASVKKKAASHGWVRTLDGRRLWIRSEHAALNTLLQGAGAIVMKQAVVLMTRMLDRLIPGEWMQVAFSHDEVQVETPARHGELVKRVAQRSIRRAGEIFNLRVPLDADGAIGTNWSQTH